MAGTIMLRTIGVLACRRFLLPKGERAKTRRLRNNPRALTLNSEMTSTQGLDRPAMRTFSRTLNDRGLSLRRRRTEILQLNVCKLCNLTCVHCHVNAGPKRKEIMTRDTVDRIIDWLGKTDVPTVDLTGGAPEMIPDFRYFIERVKELPPARHVIDRCNLTILVEDGYHYLA